MRGFLGQSLNDTAVRFTIHASRTLGKPGGCAPFWDILRGTGGAMIPLSDENPARLPPVVTVGLILACLAVFLFELTYDEAGLDLLLSQYGFTPAYLLPAEGSQLPHLPVPVWVTFVTSLFLHAGWMHVLGNMLYLWIFGNNIEDAFGHLKFIAFYLVCGIAALGLMLLTDPASNSPVVGASGAISGVLAAYMLLYPRARVRVVVPWLLILFPVQIRAVWVVGTWFALQLLTAVLTPAGEPGTAWWAHVGGFLAGLALTPLLKSSDVRYFGPFDPRGPWADG
ncbi:MAG: rhomboid family intramembrane serine protease [Proteobacteria bacterium]|nr:rhomboid family intramembrane serine protease [Pseudomonadota bacterium]